MPRKTRHGHRKYRVTSPSKGPVLQPSIAISRPPSHEHDRVSISPGNRVEVETRRKVLSEVGDKEKYAYVLDELKLVGILTVLILVILIISAAFLR